MTRILVLIATIGASAAMAADTLEKVFPCPALAEGAQKLAAYEVSRMSIRKGAATAHETAVQALANCEARNSPPRPDADPCLDERGSLRAAKDVLTKLKAEDTRQRMTLLMGLPALGPTTSPGEAAVSMKSWQEKMQECGNIDR